MADCLEHALRYAELGLPVLPIAAHTKAPAGGQGLHHASTDPARIRDWFERWPDAGVGISLAPAGLAAVDIDPRNGATQTPEDFPATLTAQTGGGGWHLLYRVPEGLSLPGKLAPGVDIKNAGYIVAEPSQHASGKRYGWIDWAALEDAMPLVAPFPTELLEQRQAERGTSGPGNGREDWLAALLAGENVHDAALRVVGSMVKAGLNDAQIRAWFEGVAQRIAEVRGVQRAQELLGEELGRMVRGARLKGFDGESEQREPDESELEDADDIGLADSAAAQAPTDSDIWLAAAFAARFGGKRFRWSDGLDWMANCGSHWERDDLLQRYTQAKALCAEIARRTPAQTRRSVASAKTVNAVLTLARSEPSIATPIEAWDCDPMILNTPAGPIDLRTGKAPANSAGALFTQVTAVAPDPGMRTPTWLRFVWEIFTNDAEMVEFLQRLLGYCLSGDRREQVLPFFQGSGANGKSVLVDELLAIWGTYALNLPSEVLMRQPHQTHPTELAQLRGKRLAISSELEDGAYWAESRIKSLTGDATLTARFMRQDFFEFRQSQKHIVVGNFRPRLKGDDPAIARRMLLVPFVEKFTGSRCDPLLPDKLAAERPGILSWLIAGAVKWAADGLFVPARVRDASAEYLAANDDISLWLEDCCALTPGVRTRTTDLYASYRAWKEAAGERAQSVNPWSGRMAQRFTPYREMRARGFEGVSLRDQKAPTYSYADVSA